jgi:RNA polymerase sigma-70 factor (ECF subfamily)
MAYRMLGSLSDRDDVLQEAWLRLNRSDADQVENMRGWLTTVVTVAEAALSRSTSWPIPTNSATCS